MGTMQTVVFPLYPSAAAATVASRAVPPATAGVHPGSSFGEPMALMVTPASASTAALPRQTTAPTIYLMDPTCLHLETAVMVDAPTPPQLQTCGLRQQQPHFYMLHQSQPQAQQHFQQPQILSRVSSSSMAASDRSASSFGCFGGPHVPPSLNCPQLASPMSPTRIVWQAPNSSNSNNSIRETRHVDGAVKPISSYLSAVRSASKNQTSSACSASATSAAASPIPAARSTIWLPESPARRPSSLASNQHPQQASTVPGPAATTTSSPFMMTQPQDLHHMRVHSGTSLLAVRGTVATMTGLSLSPAPSAEAATESPPPVVTPLRGTSTTPGVMARSKIKNPASGNSTRTRGAAGLSPSGVAPPTAPPHLPTQQHHDREIGGIETSQGKLRTSSPPSASDEKCHEASMVPSSASSESASVASAADSASSERQSVSELSKKPDVAVNPMDLLANVATVVSTYGNQPTAASVSSSSSQSNPEVNFHGTKKPGRPKKQEQQHRRHQQRPLVPLLPRRVSFEHSKAAPSSSFKGKDGKKDDSTKSKSRSGAGPPTYVDETTVLDVVASIDPRTDQLYPGNDLFRRVILLNLQRYLACTSNQDKHFVVRSIVDGLTKHGTRFLKRDTSGHCILMTPKGACDHVRATLMRGIARLHPDQAPKKKLMTSILAQVGGSATRPAPGTSAGLQATAPPTTEQRRSDAPLCVHNYAPSTAPRTAEQSGPHPKYPHPNDVVLGRGMCIANHPGNLLFRQFVLREKDLYNRSKRMDKTKIAARIANKILALNPPGRFLELRRDGRFQDADDQRVIEKTCQACRERKWAPPSSNLAPPSSSPPFSPSASSSSPRPPPVDLAHPSLSATLTKPSSSSSPLRHFPGMTRRNFQATSSTQFQATLPTPLASPSTSRSFPALTRRNWQATAPPETWASSSSRPSADLAQRNWQPTLSGHRKKFSEDARHG